MKRMIALKRTIALRLKKMIRELEDNVIRYSNERHTYVKYLQNHPEGIHFDICDLARESCEYEIEVNLLLCEMLSDVRRRHIGDYFIEEL